MSASYKPDFRTIKLFFSLATIFLTISAILQIAYNPYSNANIPVLTVMFFTSTVTFVFSVTAIVLTLTKMIRAIRTNIIPSR